MAQPGTQTYADLEHDAHQRNLPALQGSPKQIGWALDIRSGFAEELENRWLLIAVAEDTGESTDELEQAGQEILRNPSATWWIDHRYEDAESMLRTSVRSPKHTGRGSDLMALLEED